MNISWLDNHKIDNTNPKYISAQLVKKMELFSEEDVEEAFNIIATNEAIAFSLLEALSRLEDNFPSLKLRFGWINNEIKDMEPNVLLTGNTLVVGEDSHIQGFMKIQDVKTLVISAKARNENTHLAFQRHFAKHTNPQSISLGDLKADRSEAETAIRSASRVLFNIDAIKQGDSHSPQSYTTGIDIYEACTLLRLAGMSTALNLLCINTQEEKITTQTAGAISLLIWYFLEGQINKEIETMKQKENDIFLVSSDLFDEPIKFVVGHKTGRWWYQHPSTKEYLPCSDKDYKAISKGSLPDTIVSLQHSLV